MFNFFNVIFFSSLFICEVYRQSLLRTTDTTLTNHKVFEKNEYLLLQFSFLWFFFNKFLINSFFFFYVFLLSFFLYFFVFFKKNSNFIILFTYFFLQVFSTKNVISFIFIAELISISIFFILFFGTDNLTIKKTNIFYFFVTNILVFFFGSLFALFATIHYGTADTYLIAQQMFLEKNNSVTILFLAYLIFKLGQGPVIFFKFRFYRLTALLDLLFYLTVYLILIWPALSLITLNLLLSVDFVFIAAVLVIITAVLLQSVFLYSNFIDFLVFSTWSFIWYVFLLTTFYVKI